MQPGGRPDVLDVQHAMLDHTVRRARELGLANIEPRRADAHALPYPDDCFDAAYLVTVLGEIPDQDTVLLELRRVLRSGSRPIVGEVLGDPHMVRFGVLRSRAEGAGCRFQRRLGQLGTSRDLSCRRR
ncbi:MAG: class I SAM-dependent methyltransferase [Solirubrobacterales bacterium]